MSLNDLVDIGINLTSEQYQRDLPEVIKNGYLAGVAQMVITGASEKESLRAHELCLKFDPDGNRLFSTAGVHPHDAKSWNPETETVIRALAQQERVVAMGECGLDFNRDYSPRPVQEKVFEKQLELAIETQLPVFLHERDAFERFLPILKNCRDQLSNAIVHCFTGQKHELFAYLDLDLHIGMTAWLGDERRGKHLQSLMKNIPSNRLMIETDGPYLLPRTLKNPPKSRRNEPQFLPEVLRLVALYQEQSEEQVAAQTSACARAFFKLPPPKPSGDA